MNSSTDPNDTLVVSYLVLRRLVGILGIALPFVLALGALLLERAGIQNSISDYYYTLMRDVFVGILCAIGVFLYSYKGYEGDRLPGMIACLSAIGIALFPVAPAGSTDPLIRAVGVAHYLFAAVFFLSLAYFSLRLFTRTHPDAPPTPRKLQRNVVYRACGYTILAALIMIVAVKMLPVPGWVSGSQSTVVFWLEALAVVAFGISWLVKGEALLKDRP